MRPGPRPDRRLQRTCFDGFLPPVNDRPSTPMSVFRRGSTVTLAFVLRRANGTVVTPASAPTWLSPQRGARTQAGINETTASQRTTSGTRFVWRNGRWEYTWSTRNTTAGYTYRLGARLDDGTTHTLNIGVR
ncbi:MAG TPA: PxKF domain-containing protein [Nocardioides sp.]|nr:PxKF domain-containing protein [Nocardioides sp.]